MAERLPAGTAAILASVLDEGVCHSARAGSDEAMPCRIGLIALNEGIDDECLSPVLLDRLAFHIDLTPLSHHDCPPAPAPAWATGQESVQIEVEVLEALCSTAASLGAGFVRAPLLALAATRAAAALAGRSTATMEDAAIAARLVLAPRATRLPAEPPSDQQEPEPPPPNDDQPPKQQEAESQTMPPDGAEILLEAAKAAIPQGLLERILMQGDKGPQRAGAGKAGAKRKGGQRGRPVGVRCGSA